MDTSLILILLLFVLLGGAGFGWFAGSRPVADLRARLAAGEAAAKDLDERFRAAIRDLASASERAERVDAMQGELAESRASREQLGAQLATLRANAAHFDEQKRLLLEAQEGLKKEFENAGARVPITRPMLGFGVYLPAAAETSRRGTPSSVTAPARAS